MTCPYISSIKMELDAVMQAWERYGVDLLQHSVWDVDNQSAYNLLATVETTKVTCLVQLLARIDR